jgi:hypothetical protein
MVGSGKWPLHRMKSVYQSNRRRVFQRLAVGEIPRMSAAPPMQNDQRGTLAGTGDWGNHPSMSGDERLTDDSRHVLARFSMDTENNSVLSDLTDILSRTQRNRPLVQDYRPLPDSLEWRLGQHYYQRMGNKGFVTGSKTIPFQINNDGNLSYKAAELVFAASVGRLRHPTRLERLADQAATANADGYS